MKKIWLFIGIVLLIPPATPLGIIILIIYWIKRDKKSEEAEVDVSIGPISVKTKAKKSK